MAKSAYAQTGTTTPQYPLAGTQTPPDTSAPVADPGQFGAGSATTASPMGWLDVLAVLLGNSPMDVILGRTSTDVSGFSAQLGDPNSQAYYAPTGTTQGMAVRNNLYQTPGMPQLGVSRHTGVILRPGQTPDVTKYIVDTSNLPADLKSKAKDTSAMSRAGYVAFVKPGTPDQPGKLQWIHQGARYTVQADMAKQGFVPQDDNKPYGPNLVDSADLNGRSVIGSVTATATPVQLLTALYALPADQLVTLQHKMWSAGLYQGSSMPVWGVVDDSTRDAYVAAMKNSLAHPDQTMDESMATLGEQSFSTRHAARKAKEDKALAAAGVGADTVSLTSEEEVASIVDRTAQSLLGYNLPGDEIKRLTHEIQGRQTAQAQATHDVAVANAQKSSGKVPEADLDRFVNLFAVPHAEQFPNVVGHLGMRPKEWPSWLAKVNMDPTTPFTPDNERRVMKEVAADFYDQFGNWQDVAIAMLSGPSAGWADISSGLAPVQGGSGHGSSTVNKGKEISRLFSDGTGNTAQVDANAAAAAGGPLVPVESVDPSAIVEADIKAKHPLQYNANSFVDRTQEFMNMLGPSVPSAGQPL